LKTSVKPPVAHPRHVGPNKGGINRGEKQLFCKIIGSKMSVLDNGRMFGFIPTREESDQIDYKI